MGSLRGLSECNTFEKKNANGCLITTRLDYSLLITVQMPYPLIEARSTSAHYTFVSVRTVSSGLHISTVILSLRYWALFPAGEADITSIPVTVLQVQAQEYFV